MIGEWEAEPTSVIWYERQHTFSLVNQSNFRLEVIWIQHSNIYAQIKIKLWSLEARLRPLDRPWPQISQIWNWWPTFSQRVSYHRMPWARSWHWAYLTKKPIAERVIANWAIANRDERWWHYLRQNLPIWLIRALDSLFQYIAIIATEKQTVKSGYALEDIAFTVPFLIVKF